MKIKFLKLSAKTNEDLKVISAHLQDAITQSANIVHLKKNRMLLLQFNRFMWEDVEKGVFRKNKRILSILKFENVISVYSKNLNQKKKDDFLDFLAIESKLLSDKGYDIILHFAGNKLIKINSEVIDCFLDDQGEPWETKNKPKHEIFDE
tara:strand:+ start:295 stop:744 length:450 start_codon:yes stop_codon:yes gene_type:complete